MARRASHWASVVPAAASRASSARWGVLDLLDGPAQCLQIRQHVLILIDGVDVNVDAHPIRDFFALDARGVAKYAWHDADRFYVDPSIVPVEQAARTKANMAPMRVIAGLEMNDPKLMRRLARVRIPILAIWGDSDGIVTPAYGAAFAGAF